MNNSNPDDVDLLAEKIAEVVRSDALRFFERGEG